MYLCVWASLSLSPRRCAIEEDGFNTHEENVRVICEGQVHPFKKNKVMGKILVKKLLLHRPGVERRRVGASSRENINNRPTDQLGFSYLFSPVFWLPFMDLSAACVSLSLSLYSNLFFHTFFCTLFWQSHVSCSIFFFFFFFSFQSDRTLTSPHLGASARFDYSKPDFVVRSVFVPLFGVVFWAFSNWGLQQSLNDEAGQSTTTVFSFIYSQ